jgi:hypothetical protein
MPGTTKSKTRMQTILKGSLVLTVMREIKKAV